MSTKKYPWIFVPWDILKYPLILPTIMSTGQEEERLKNLKRRKCEKSVKIIDETKCEKSIKIVDEREFEKSIKSLRR
jgi:hypothetical protein